MDQPKIELPPWLPWATTAILAALVACLGELLFIERARTHFLREQGQLAQTAMQGAQNQLEAERILERRAVENLRAQAKTGRALDVILLAPAPGAAPGAPAMGALALDASDGRGLIGLPGATEQPPQRDYQLWLTRPGATPADCGVFHGAPGAGATLARIKVQVPLSAGARFVLVDGRRGGSATLEQAQADGSIVLASLPFAPRIPSP